jgi:hypothetical protein
MQSQCFVLLLAVAVVEARVQAHVHAFVAVCGFDIGDESQLSRFTNLDTLI